MTVITQFKGGEYYFKIPESWGVEISNWKMLPAILEEVLKDDKDVLVDVEAVEELTSDMFNLLFDLAGKVGKTKAKLHFVGANEGIEERISLLSNSSE